MIILWSTEWSNVGIISVFDVHALGMKYFFLQNQWMTPIKEIWLQGDVDGTYVKLPPN
jgi:hypothetical protein